MCVLIEYQEGKQTVRVRFTELTAALPVKTRQGGVVFVSWGRRQSQAGKLPLGGWARLDAIRAGRWDHRFPVPVKLPVTGFEEHDIEGAGHHYELSKGQWVQGLVVRDRHEQRVYVVTITPEREDAIHDRWPRILSY